MRPIGSRSMTCRRTASMSLVPRLRARVTSTWSPISVPVMPGCIELTRMRYPLRANSSAADFVNSVTPPLVSVYRSGSCRVDKLSDRFHYAQSDRNARKIAIRRKLVGALGAFHPRVVAVVLEHQIGDAPDIDLR